MSAHKVPLKRNCESAGCTQAARWIVRNTYNAEMGRYCGRHADEVIRNLRSRE